MSKVASLQDVTRRNLIAGIAATASVALPSVGSAAEPADSYDEIMFAIDGAQDACDRLDEYYPRREASLKARGLSGWESHKIKNFVANVDDYHENSHDIHLVRESDIEGFFNYRLNNVRNFDESGWGSKYERMYADYARAFELLRDRQDAEAEWERSDERQRLQAECDELIAQQKDACRTVCELPCLSLRDVQAKAAFALDVMERCGELDDLCTDLLASMRGAG